MIEFSRLKLKNFMSYGNAWTEIDLQQGKVLLCGVNGAGKSSLITDGVSFALFGKPFRKVNIPQLVNSINGKDCQVELSFSINKDNYRLNRGLKPSKFEVYKNGELIKQEAATRDYQSYLENQILKINHKTFIQILVLGSAVFTPFMQLPAGARRQVIEDLLDINVFSSMMKLLKEKIQQNKEETLVIDTKLISAKKESVSQKRLIETISTKNSDLLQQYQEELQTNHIKIDEYRKEVSSLIEDQVAHSKSLVEYDSKLLESLQEQFSFLKRDLQSGVDKAKKISSIDECPACLQEVNSDHKKHVEKSLKKKYTEQKPVLDKLEADIANISEKKKQYDATFVIIQGIISALSSAESKLDFYVTHGESIQSKIDKHKNSTNSDLDREKDKLRELAQSALKLIERKNELISEKSIQEVSLGLLKDTGIKASIIREYLPILNKTINKYLVEFDFFINFILDENFDEQLLSRGRDHASYFSLSEGEKKRVDVAILLAFRLIASLKNSAKINLLVLDELDSGLDHESRLRLLEMIYTMDSDVWMVSHSIQNTELEQGFDKIAHVLKKGDFSEISIK